MVDFTYEEVDDLIAMATNILRIVGHAQGRADSYAARRDEFIILQFPTNNSKEEEGKKQEKKQEKSIAPKSAFYFTKKEISKMPKDFQKIITIKLPIPVRQKDNGVYEARFRRYGFDIEVSSVDFDKLKGKFMKKLLDASPKKEELAEPAPAAPPFGVLAARWLELKRPTVKPITFVSYESILRVNVLPVLGEREVTEIRQSDVQALVNSYLDTSPRTSVKVFQTLNAIFEFAVGDDLIEKSPMRKMKPPIYEEKSGVALTVEEEREFLRLLFAGKVSNEVRHALLFLLYTGIRRSELASAKIEDGFVSVVCAKVRKGRQERRRNIPITPMLARWLPQMNFDELRTVRVDALTQAMKRLMPNHHLHELRHTFITRAQECGVPREVVSVWAGHAADETQTTKVYTKFSREFMKKEGEKIIYNL